MEFKYITDSVQLMETKQSFEALIEQRKSSDSNQLAFNNTPVMSVLFFEALNYKGETKNVGELSRKASINFLHYKNPILSTFALSDSNSNAWDDDSYEWGGKEYSFDQKAWNLEILQEIDKDSPLLNILNNVDYLNYFLTFEKPPEEFRQGEDLHRITSVEDVRVFNTEQGDSYFIHAKFTTTPMKKDFPNIFTKSLLGINQPNVLRDNKLRIHTKQPLFSIDTYSTELKNGNSLNDKTIIKPIAEETKTFGDYLESQSNTILAKKSGSSTWISDKSFGNFLYNPTFKDNIPKDFFQGDNYVALPLNVTKNSNEEVRFYSRWFDSVKSMNPFWLIDSNENSLFKNLFKDGLTWLDIKKILNNNLYLIRTFQAIKTVCDARLLNWFGAPEFKLDPDPAKSFTNSLNAWVTSAKDKNNAEFGLMIDDFIIRPAKINSRKSLIIDNFAGDNQLLRWVGNTTASIPTSSEWNRLYGLLSSMVDSIFSTLVDENFSPNLKHSLINGFILSSSFAIPSTGTGLNKNFEAFDNTSVWNDSQIMLKLVSNNFKVEQKVVGEGIIKTENKQLFGGSAKAYHDTYKGRIKPWEKNPEFSIYRYKNALNVQLVKPDVFGIGSVNGSSEILQLFANSYCGIFLGNGPEDLGQKRVLTSGGKESTLLEKINSNATFRNNYGSSEQAASMGKNNTVPGAWASKFLLALPVSLNYDYGHLVGLVFSFLNPFSAAAVALTGGLSSAWEREIQMERKVKLSLDDIFENKYFFGDSILCSNKKPSWRRTEQKIETRDASGEAVDSQLIQALGIRENQIEDYMLRYASTVHKAEKGWSQETYFLEIPERDKIFTIFNSLTEEGKKEFKENFSYTITFSSWYWQNGTGKPKNRTGGVIWTNILWKSNWTEKSTGKVRIEGNMLVNNLGARPNVEYDNTNLIVNNNGSTIEDIVKIQEQNGDANLTNEDYYWVYLTTAQWFYMFQKLRQNHFEEMNDLLASKSDNTKITYRKNGAPLFEEEFTKKEFYKGLLKKMVNPLLTKPFFSFDQIELPSVTHELEFFNKNSPNYDLDSKKQKYFEDKELSKMKLGIIGNGRTIIDLGGGLTYEIDQSNAYEENSNEVQWWIEF